MITEVTRTKKITYHFSFDQDEAEHLALIMSIFLGNSGYSEAKRLAEDIYNEIAVDSED